MYQQRVYLFECLKVDFKLSRIRFLKLEDLERRCLVRERGKRNMSERGLSRFGHLTHRLQVWRHNESASGCLLDLVDSDTIGYLGENETLFLVDFEDALLCDDHVDHAVAGQRERALLQDLRLAGLKVSNRF